MRYPFLASVIILSGLLLGCLRSQIVSLEEYTAGWIGHPVNELRTIVLQPTSYASRTGWKETTYKLGDGYWIYVEPEKKGCIIHWKIDPNGIIVGYKTEGERCYK